MIGKYIKSFYRKNIVEILNYNQNLIGWRIYSKSSVRLYHLMYFF